MESKSLLYAAVGAPVVTARKVGDKVHDMRTKLSQGVTEAGKAAEKTFNAWAAEGEKMVDKLSDRKMVDELAAKVDLDQAKEQVTKLRDQLEDMLDTWRSSFRPERAQEKSAPAAETAAAKPAAKRPAAKSTAAKKPAARKPASRPSSAKTTESIGTEETDKAS